MNQIKRFFLKIVSILPWVLMYLGIFGLSYSLSHGLSESVKYETKAETLAAENEYLKGEIEWFRERLADTLVVTDGAEATDVQPSGGE